MSKPDCLLQDQFEVPGTGERKRGKLVYTAQVHNLVSRVLCQGFETKRGTGSLLIYGSKKVKQSHYRPRWAQRVVRKLRFPDFVTTAQDGGRLSALSTGRFYPQEILLAHFSFRG